MRSSLKVLVNGVGRPLLMAALISIGLGVLDSGGAIFLLRHSSLVTRQWVPGYILRAIEVDLLAMLVLALLLAGSAEAIASRKAHRRDARWKLAFVASALLAWATAIASTGALNAALPPLPTKTKLLVNAPFASTVLLGAWRGLFKLFFERGWSPWRAALGWTSLGLVLMPVFVWSAKTYPDVDLRPDAPRRLEADLSRAPNVLFLLIDTLRAGHLPFYGYGRPTAPFLDSLARQGILFRNAYAPSSWTLPSTVSALTSLYPSSHGVTGYDETAVETDQYLPYVLQKLGYNTAALFANPFFHHGGFGKGTDYGIYFPWSGWSQHFCVLCKTYMSLTDRAFPLFRSGPWTPSPLKGKLLAQRAPGNCDGCPSADDLNGAALRYLRALRGRPDHRQEEARFFVYIHYMEPHDPYDPPPPFLTLFGPAGDITDPHPRGASHTEEEATHLVNRYDGEIAYIDDSLRRFFSQLDKEGFLDNTLVIVTSDHGEEFFEHGGHGHGKTLFNEVLQVPLVFWSPDLIDAPREVEEIVEMTDIFPTLLGIIGVPVAETYQGRDVSSLMWGSAPRDDGRPGEAFGELGESAGRWLSLYEGKYHYIRALGRPGRPQVPVREWLFDVRDDPLEQRDLAGDLPAEADRLKRRALAKHDLAKSSKVAKPSSKGQTPEQLKRLRSLGYVQ